MQFSPVFKNYFVFATFALALIHFVLETAYTIFVGQSFLGYLPDCIADLLLIAGGYVMLKNNQASGLLCGAWGFTFCLHYRTWAWRFEDYQAGTLNDVQTDIMYVLATTMIISLICFAITVMMNWPQAVKTED